MPRLPESRGKNWYQTELQRHTSHGRREEDLVFLCVSAEMDTLLGSCVVCVCGGGGVPYAKKAYKGAAPSKEWNIGICSNMEGRILSKITHRDRQILYDITYRI